MYESISGTVYHFSNEVAEMAQVLYSNDALRNFIKEAQGINSEDAKLILRILMAMNRSHTHDE